LGIAKKELLWKAHQLSHKSPDTQFIQTRLFSTEVKDYKLPDLAREQYEDAFDQMEIIGFPLCNPFDLLEDQEYPRLRKSDLSGLLKKTIDIVGYLITVKNTSTKKGDRMIFGTFLDIEGHFLDTVHFPDVARKFPFMGKGVYQIKGKVVEEFGYYSIETIGMTKLTYISDPRFREEEIEKDKLITSFMSN